MCATGSPSSTSAGSSRRGPPPMCATTRGCSRPISASTSTAPPRRGPTMLQVEDVVTTYGAVRALDGVSVNVDAGTITSVLGANGAGKTTLLRTVNGLVRPRAGRITYESRDLL